VFDDAQGLLQQHARNDVLPRMDLTRERYFEQVVGAAQQLRGFFLVVQFTLAALNNERSDAKADQYGNGGSNQRSGQKHEIPFPQFGCLELP
jgi:hypothetical protein